MGKIRFAFVALALTGCGYYNEVLQNPQAAGQAPFKQGQTLGFEIVNVILGRNRCLECHTAEKGNRGGVNLEGYASVKANAAGLVATTKSGFMPMGGPLVSSGDVAVLEAWANAGAPEVSDIPVPGAQGPAPTPAPIENPGEAPGTAGPDFARVKAQIFAPHCVGCHAGFADYARVKARLSGIQNAIDTNFMPKNAPPLSAELKTLLAEWIAAGAPESIQTGNGQEDNQGGGGQRGECDDDDDPRHGRHCCDPDPRHGEHCCGNDPRHGDDDCDALKT